MWRRLVLREAVHLFLILAAVSLLHHTVGAFEVEGASMEPTLHSRQYVVVDTLLPRARSVQRGEVIVFRYPRNPDVEYVKRVVGLPGEVLAVAHGRVWIDGNPLQEAYVRDLPRYVWGPGRVPQGSVFVLGDNRNSSSNSHLWGPVPLSHVVGRAIFAWGPPVRWSWLGGRRPASRRSQRWRPPDRRDRRDPAGPAGPAGPPRLPPRPGSRSLCLPAHLPGRRVTYIVPRRARLAHQPGAGHPAAASVCAACPVVGKTGAPGPTIHTGGERVDTTPSPRLPTAALWLGVLACGAFALGSNLLAAGPRRGPGAAHRGGDGRAGQRLLLRP